MQTEIISKVKDPRVLGKVRHGLEDVLRIALIGVLCSCEDYGFLRFFQSYYGTEVPAQFQIFYLFVIAEKLQLSR